jgi:ribonuclease P protein component
VRTADFQRVLGVPPCSRSPHFAVHHVSGVPSPAFRPAGAGLEGPVSTELSTDRAPAQHKPVDDLPVEGWWLGAVVPKRHARRAVTRSLLKRQIRAAVERHAPRLPAGLWVVRLRAPFDRTAFPSAASNALRAAARTELDVVLARASR